ncbi:MAG: carbamoyl phosphate synthase small subunit [Clostridia bacterium]
MFENLKKAYLLLADGTEFEGYSFGCEGEVVGEVVFSTASTGYQESLTDPSYNDQIVTQTFPLIGNYGINSSDFESDKCHLSGYVVRQWCEYPSNFRCEETIDTFLKKQNVVGIYGIDTRALTRILREHGVMGGIISTLETYTKENGLKKIKQFKPNLTVKPVSVKEKQVFRAENKKYTVALMDYGYKFNIRRDLLKRGCDVIVLPSNTNANEIKALNVDGIMLSNGPGDPTSNIEEVENLKQIAELGIPMFGICLGHQLLALSQGAKTFKLKYGHRGENQPVTDIDLDKTFVTSQNHGYTVDKNTIDKSVGYVSHINANDSSCEGVKYTKFNAFTVQFHPEACGGPQDTAFLFDRFIENIEKSKK